MDLSFLSSKRHLESKSLEKLTLQQTKLLLSLLEIIKIYIYMYIYNSNKIGKCLWIGSTYVLWT